VASLLISSYAGLIFFLLVLLVIVISNLRTLRRLDAYGAPIRWPRVSILVPARNEEANIGPCVHSLLAQQYPNFQVLVLDDQSTDGTWQILTKLVAGYERLQVLRGQSLPPGWLGKHWACHQLAQVADGEFLLFTDADTRHHPLALANAVAALQTEEADFLTALPHEEAVSWAERLIIPLIPWSIFSFVPLVLADRLRFSFLSAAIGQFMLFRRPVYEAIGGYEAVRHQVVDDLALARRIKAQGWRWRLVDGGHRIRCRMYHNFEQVYQGIGKNLFAVFNYNIAGFVFVWLWLGIVFLGPLLLLGLSMGGLLFQDLRQLSSQVIALSITAVILALLLWGLIHWRFGFSGYLTFLYPITILLAIIIAFSSLLFTLTGRATWKNRRLVRPKLR
jgi:chlorobactene glucosyltransferase